MQEHFAIITMVNGGARFVSGPHDTKQQAELAAQEINSRLHSSPFASVISTPDECTPTSDEIHEDLL